MNISSISVFKAALAAGFLVSTTAVVPVHAASIGNYTHGSVSYGVSSPVSAIQDGTSNTHIVLTKELD